MSLKTFRESLNKANTILESASTVNELTRQSNFEKVKYVVTGASKKFPMIKNLVATRFSPNATVTLEGDTIVVEGPMKNSLEALLKKYGTVTRG